MKKIIIASVFLSLFASSAFAAQALITTAGTTIGGATFTPSTKVNIAYEANTTAYAAASKHLNGTYIYDTDSVTSTINQTLSTAGTALASTDAPSLPASL